MNNIYTTKISSENNKKTPHKDRMSPMYTFHPNEYYNFTANNQKLLKHKEMTRRNVEL